MTMTTINQDAVMDKTEEALLNSDSHAMAALPDFIAVHPAVALENTMKYSRE